MDIFREKLSDRSAGKALDVGCGQGYFLQVVMDYSKDIESIVGVDIIHNYLKAAAEKFTDRRVSFSTQKAESLAFRDNTFDTVSVCVSLHHMSDAGKALKEMKRVLKPGGLMIIAEMHQTDQNEAQMTQILWHHLGAQMDRLLGVCHNETFHRDELLALVKETGLTVNETFEYNEDKVEDDSKEKVDSMVSVLDAKIEKMADRDEYESLKARFEEVKERFYTIGVQSPTLLVIFGTKS